MAAAIAAAAANAVSDARSDNNCQAYGKTQMCFDSKHICVLIGKTHLCFAEHICVFNLWGLFVEYIFGRTLTISKIQHRRFQENMESRQNHFFVRIQYPPPFFSIQCLPGMDGAGHHTPPSCHERIPQDLQRNW